VSPAPQDLAGARQRAGLTQEAAAALIDSTRRTWQDWEAGKAAMPPGMWRLFRHVAGLARIPFRSAR